MFDPFVSVVVLNWNGEHIIEKCLMTLQNQNYENYEVMVVDNGSRDKSLDIIRARFSWVKLISLGKNFGVGIGYNVGFSHSKGKYVIALNNDTEVQSNFIRRLVSEAEKDPTIACVGCKIIQYDSQKVVYGPLFSISGGIIATRPISAFLTGASYQPQFDRKSTVIANCACAALYRKNILKKVGGFENLFVTDWDDIDLGLKMNLAGFKSVYVPDTIVYHVGGATVGKMWGYPRLANVIRNMIITYYKNFEISGAVQRIAIHIIFYEGYGLVEWVAGRLLMKTPLPIFASILKGVFMFLRQFKEIQRHRLFAQSLRRVSDEKIVKLGSIHPILLKS